MSAQSAQAAIRTYEKFMAGNGPFSLSAPPELAGSIKEYTPRDALENKMMADRRIEKRRMAEEAKEQDALAVIRYVVLKVLGWQPQDALDHLSPELVNTTRLDLLARYVSYPPYIPKDDMAWAVHKAFPDRTKYNETERLYEIYQRVLDGDLPRFPKGLFSGRGGTYRLGLVLKDYISKHVPGSSVRELYKMFSIPAEGWKILTQAKLFHVTRDPYDTPLDMLHDTLGYTDEGNPFYYNYYQCTAVFRAVEEDMMKNHRNTCSAT